MPRSIPTAILTGLQQPVVQPYFAVEMLFDSGAVRIWSGLGNRTIGGNVYTGTGNLMMIDGLNEVSDIAAKTATVTLSGLDSATIALALAEPYQRRQATIIMGLVDVPADFMIVFAGYMNTMDISDDADSATITLSIDSKLIDLEKATNLRYTQQAQEAQYPGDTFFSYVAGMVDREFTWGR